MLFLTCSLLHFGLPYLAKGFVFPSAKIVIKLQWQNRNELLVPIRALQRYRLVRYAGTVWSAMMVPIQALRWYRYKRYDGTVSPILSNKTTREADDDDKQEADKASKNIKRILSVKTCDFSTNGYISLHRRIFEGVIKHVGEMRKYDITKREWVLEGDTVSYLNWEDLRRAVDYDIQQERDFSYKGISNDELVAHIANFVSGLWQIHAFGEGNTRTTAVFTIQYLRSLGFNVENDLFAKHSWYFRNALVRANYKNAIKGIDYSPVFLERFFRNLLLGEQWNLRNRYLHINPPAE